jgi:hypothetical protein
MHGLQVWAPREPTLAIGLEESYNRGKQKDGIYPCPINCPPLIAI